MFLTGAFGRFSRRLIPACAGNPTSSMSDSMSSTVHPRARGAAITMWTPSQRLRTLAELPLDVELRDLPITPVYQKIAAEAAEMDADGARISLMARHFGVDDKTVKKAIAWFHVGRSRS